MVMLEWFQNPKNWIFRQRFKEKLIKQDVPKKNICGEIESSANSNQNHQVFHKLVEIELKKNDLLLVTKLNWYSKNTLSFLKLQEKFFLKIVTFVLLDFPYSSNMAVNKLIATKLIAIVTFE